MPGFEELIVLGLLLAGGTDALPAASQPSWQAPSSSSDACALIGAGRYDEALASLGGPTGPAMAGFLRLAEESGTSLDAAAWLRTRWLRDAPRDLEAAARAAWFVACKESTPEALRLLTGLRALHPEHSGLASTEAGILLLLHGTGHPVPDYRGRSESALQVAARNAREAWERVNAWRRTADHLAWEGRAEASLRVLEGALASRELPASARAEVQFEAGILLLRLGDPPSSADRFLASVEAWCDAAETAETDLLPYPEAALAFLQHFLVGRPVVQVPVELAARVEALRPPGSRRGSMQRLVQLMQSPTSTERDAQRILMATRPGKEALLKRYNPAGRCPNYLGYSRDLLLGGLLEVRAQAWLRQGRVQEAVSELEEKLALFPRLEAEGARLEGLRRV